MPSPLDHQLRDLAPQVLAILTRRFHDFAAAEDAVQEALLAAATEWPSAGPPDNPKAWLISVAWRRLIDHIRSESARRRREAAVEPAPISADSEKDDTLILLFMCCHPSLTPPSAIALTLRAVGGLTTAEIAAAFLVPESTMAQRISRAKAAIKSSGIPFAMPTAADRADRVRSVLHVLYLIFNEGYAATSGPDLLRPDLSREAIRLARALHSLLRDDPEAAGLLALMLLTDARRAARTGPSGEIISLSEQDRSLWDARQIREGVALITRALAHGSVGPYQLQAAIAAVHDEAPTPEATDWPQILALYDLLRRVSDNPMVTLNHAIAFAMVHGPRTGLDLLDALDSDPRLASHHRLPAVRAHLLEKCGDVTAAVEHYRLAAARATSLPERDYLLLQAARLSE